LSDDEVACAAAPFRRALVAPEIGTDCFSPLAFAISSLASSGAGRPRIGGMVEVNVVKGHVVICVIQASSALTSMVNEDEGALRQDFRTNYAGGCTSRQAEEIQRLTATPSTRHLNPGKAILRSSLLS